MEDYGRNRFSCDHKVDSARALTSDTSQQLTSERLDVMTWERRKFVLFQEVVYAHPQQLRYKTYMVSMVKPVKQVDAFANG